MLSYIYQATRVALQLEKYYLIKYLACCLYDQSWGGTKEVCNRHCVTGVTKTLTRPSWLGGNVRLNVYIHVPNPMPSPPIPPQLPPLQDSVCTVLCGPSLVVRPLWTVPLGSSLEDSPLWIVPHGVSLVEWLCVGTYKIPSIWRWYSFVEICYVPEFPFFFTTHGYRCFF